MILKCARPSFDFGFVHHQQGNCGSHQGEIAGLKVHRTENRVARFRSPSGASSEFHSVPVLHQRSLHRVRLDRSSTSFFGARLTSPAMSGSVGGQSVPAFVAFEGRLGGGGLSDAFLAGCPVATTSPGTVGSSRPVFAICSRQGVWPEPW